MINNLYIKATPTTASVTWGDITGTLSDQTDLQSALDAKQATLVSGTNIKTINSTSLLGSGNVAVEPTITAGTTSQYYRGDKTFQTLDKSAVGLSNVDNTSDVNKPISTAQATAIAAKQDTLVSGTNIKTLEGQSLLGSGNIDLSKSDVGLANVDNTSDLSKPISTATQTALNAKQDTLTLTTTGTSGAATLVGSTLNIPQYSGGGGGIGGIQAFFPVSGNLLPASAYGGFFGSAMIPDRILIYAFVPSRTFTTSALRINVTSAIAGANARILIYSNASGSYRPNSKILETTNLDCSTTGEKSFLYSATFTQGVVYWIGTYSNANPSVSHIPSGNLFTLRQEQANAMVHIEGSYTFGTAPTTYPTTVGYNNRNCPNVGFLIA